MPELFKRNPVKIGGHSAVDILIQSEGDKDKAPKPSKKKGKSSKFEFPKASLEKSVTPMEAKKRVMDARDATGKPATEAQASVGNYKKGRLYMHGMEFMLENPKGSVRSGVDADGNAWSVRLKCDYGYIRRTEGYDGDQVDVFFGPNPESEIVFVVNQVIGGKFDEHKCMFGFNTIEQAKSGYLENYQDDWKGLGSIVPMTIQQFKTWVQSAKQGPAVIDLQKALITQLVRSELYKSTNCGANAPGGGGFQPGNTCGSLRVVDGVKLPKESMKPRVRDILEQAEYFGQDPVAWFDETLAISAAAASDFVSGSESYKNRLYAKIEKHIESKNDSSESWEFGGQYYEDWIIEHVETVAEEKVREWLKGWKQSPELAKAFAANCRWVTLNADGEGAEQGYASAATAESM